jgi:hypothetical protein
MVQINMYAITTQIAEQSWWQGFSSHKHYGLASTLEKFAFITCLLNLDTLDFND